MDLDQPVATTEFLVVDTETNGLAGDACELTEVGAVLVGGGELHERWETLLTVRAPLSRGIQRFTGITQAMVDEAPPAEAQLPELAAQLRGRVLVAHSASFDRRVLRQAFERAGLRWPNPPQLCTVALARRLHPLGAPAPAAWRWPSRWGSTSRSPTARWPTPRRARACSARSSRGCARTRRRSRDALELVRPARPRRPRAKATDGPARTRGARRRLPDLGPPDRRPRRLRGAQRVGPGHLRRQVGQRAHAGARALPGLRARGGVGRAGRDGRARAHELRARRAAAREPPDQAPAPAGQRAPEARRPLRLPALPPGHRLPGARGGARAGGRPRRQRRAAARARGGGRAARAAQLAVRAAPLRAQAPAPLLAERLRADGALPVAVPGRPRPQPLPPPPRRGAGALHRRGRRRRRAAGPPRRRRCARPPPSRTSSARPGCAAGASAWRGCSSAWAACWPPPTRARGSCWPSTRAAGAATRSGSWAGAWSTGGRRATSTRSMERTVRALRGGDGTGATACLAPDEVDEARIVATWLDAPRRARRSTSTAAPTAPPWRACWRQRTTTVMPMPGECRVQTIR